MQMILHLCEEKYDLLSYYGLIYYKLLQIQRPLISIKILDLKVF